jgi:hypothetical protein
MGSCCLRNLIVGGGLDRVDEIWEADGVLNKEYRDVVSYDILMMYISMSRALLVARLKLTKVSFIGVAVYLVSKITALKDNCVFTIV